MGEGAFGSLRCGLGMLTELPQPDEQWIIIRRAEIFARSCRNFNIYPCKLVLLVGMGDHYEEHPGTIQYKPAKKNENKIENDIVIMKPCFNFLEDHLVHTILSYKNIIKLNIRLKGGINYQFSYIRTFHSTIDN